jgi:hypothetical protein
LLSPLPDAHLDAERIDWITMTTEQEKTLVREIL